MSSSKELESESDGQSHGSWSSELWEIVKVLLVSLAIVLPIRYFIAQPFIVRGASMEPNFENSEYLVIDEASYYFRKPERGEVIVFRYPRDPRQFFIKRIIGLPGETVEIKGGRISIFNPSHSEGFLLQETYLNPPNRPTHPDVKVMLAERQYFVLGDNRGFSSDSRVWGTLSREFIVGRGRFRGWAPAAVGLVT